MSNQTNDVLYERMVEELGEKGYTMGSSIFDDDCGIATIISCNPENNSIKIMSSIGMKTLFIKDLPNADKDEPSNLKEQDRIGREMDAGCDQYHEIIDNELSFPQ